MHGFEEWEVYYRNCGIHDSYLKICLWNSIYYFSPFRKDTVSWNRLNMIFPPHLTNNNFNNYQGSINCIWFWFFAPQAQTDSELEAKYSCLLYIHVCVYTRKKTMHFKFNSIAFYVTKTFWMFVQRSKLFYSIYTTDESLWIKL